MLANVGDVQKLVSKYEEADRKSVNRAEFIKKFDYIKEPKPDGYRGVHLVYKYRSAAPDKAPWLGLRIELQLRSRLQHAWATAVETVDMFTSQAIKTGGGEQSWRRFFALMGTAIAQQEDCPCVPGTPADTAALIQELRTLAASLAVDLTLSSFGLAVEHIEKGQGVSDAVYFLGSSRK